MVFSTAIRLANCFSRARNEKQDVPIIPISIIGLRSTSRKGIRSFARRFCTLLRRIWGSVPCSFSSIHACQVFNVIKNKSEEDGAMSHRSCRGISIASLEYTPTQEPYRRTIHIMSPCLREQEKPHLEVWCAFLKNHRFPVYLFSVVCWRCQYL